MQQRDKNGTFVHLHDCCVCTRAGKFYCRTDNPTLTHELHDYRAEVKKKPSVMVTSLLCVFKRALKMAGIINIPRLQQQHPVYVSEITAAAN